MVRLTNNGVVKDSIFFSPGAVYLEEKTRPSQHLSTSSDVSVKLEVEDRKPGPSQLFDSFEISPSDMQVDSPRSKKIFDNGDGDIKPNKCHDSDEVGIWMALLLWTSLMAIVTFRMTMIWITKDTLYSEIEKLDPRNFLRYPHFRT